MWDKKLEVPCFLLFFFSGGNVLVTHDNPPSLKEGTETSRRWLTELGYRFDRLIYFESELDGPMHFGVQLLRPAAADHSVSLVRQEVHCIQAFRWGAEPGTRQLSGGTATMATISVPSFRDQGLPYVTGTFSFSQSLLTPHRWPTKLESLPKRHGCCPF